MMAIAINPDQPLWQFGPVLINQTLLTTWIVMLVLVIASWQVTRQLSATLSVSRSQHLLEVLVEVLQQQIREVSQMSATAFLPFIGTLFLFIAVSNLLSLIPGFQPPTGSLSTTAALATCVFVAVPLYGISRNGVRDYLKQYLRPSIFMLPFNLIGELSRTLALAVRLYGNMMSGTVIGAILLSFVPLFVPIVMQLFGLLTGMIQAYIFAILAMVYIASAARARDSHEETSTST